MKRILLIGFWACLVGSVQAEDPSYLETVSRKWLNGQWNEVRDIGYARIAADTNDIAGYIFLLECDVRESNVSNALDRLTRIQTLGESFTGEYFRDKLPGLAFTRDIFKTLAASGPIEFDAADRQKSSLTNKSFGSDHMLEALEKDCYFATNAAERQAQQLKNIREMLVPSGNFLTENRRDPLSIIGYAERHNVPTKEVNRIALEVAKEQKAELESGGEYTRWYRRAIGYMILRPDPIYLPFLEEASRSTNGFVRAKALLGCNAVKEAQTTGGKKLRPRSNADSTLFSGTATESERLAIRFRVVDNLTDQATLAKIALEDECPIIRRLAISKLSDRAVLTKIAVEDDEEYNRKDAAERLAHLK